MKTKRVPQSRRKKSRGIDLKPYLLGIGIFLSVLVMYIGYRIYSAERILIPLSVLALLSGLLFEYRRLSKSWNKVLLTALGAFIFSFIVFLPGRNEELYSLEHHIEMWPYAFCFIFVVIAIIAYEKEVTPKLTEGITLLQSLAVAYWVTDLGIVNAEFLILKALMIVGLLFSLFSVFHAFSYTPLSRTTRLTLSIWSSIVMVLLAFDNAWSVFQNEQIEATSNLTNGVYVAGQYFLLGISCIYMMQNFMMVTGFLPGKGTFFNKQYFRDLNELKGKHISRYSTEQVDRLHSLLCVLFTGAIFWLNHYFNLLPRNFMIWTVFIVFPIVLSLLNMNTRNTASRSIYR
ncbi:hypothetical protein [Pontibacter ramchanderi]|uniref:Uncharacterized protein n=1 Tax=Pontibacter ramchanderi TaxID=1179743 RepID=A0A2N3UCE4_9BACT|nr:hypothetical protein [Pontibacter ramchanderi]PKV67068.1 hypothetical protein BD749_2207 [Pontibacter ramchanderi]